MPKTTALDLNRTYTEDVDARQTRVKTMVNDNWQEMFERERDAHRETKRQLAEARREIDALKQELADLKAVVAQLQRGGTHAPPSTRKPWNPKPAPPKAPTGNKPGGQPGHKGVSRPYVTPDKVVDHYTDGTGDHHEDNPDVIDVEVGDRVTDRAGVWRLVERRQVVDVTVTRQVVEHRVWQLTSDPDPKPAADLFPKEATAPVAFHPHVKAMSLFLACGAQTPDRWTAKCLTELLTMDVSKTTTQNWVRQAAENLDGFMTRVKALALLEPVLGADETPIRVTGTPNAHLHVVGSDKVTVFHVAGRTTEDVNAGGVLPGFTGTLVSDCYAPYWTFEVTHQRCNAHLRRDLQEVIAAHDGWTGDPGAWARTMLEHVDDTHLKTQGSKDGLLTPRQYTVARNRMVALATQGLDTHPPDKKDSTTRNARALANRLVKHADEYLVYTRSPDVPYTNNLSEQALRPAKVRQKRSGCYRSLQSAVDRARLNSYLDTGRKHGHPPMWLLERLVAGDPWLPDIPKTG